MRLITLDRYVYLETSPYRFLDVTLRYHRAARLMNMLPVQERKVCYNALARDAFQRLAEYHISPGSGMTPINNELAKIGIIRRAPEPGALKFYFIGPDILLVQNWRGSAFPHSVDLYFKGKKTNSKPLGMHEWRKALESLFERSSKIYYQSFLKFVTNKYSCFIDFGFPALPWRIDQAFKHSIYARSDWGYGDEFKRFSITPDSVVLIQKRDAKLPEL